jgi:hypothetical protein
MKVSDADLGWMAAIIDIKGSVITKSNKTRQTPQITLKVDTTNQQIAERLCALTGVSPEPHKLSETSAVFYRRGCKVHCLEPHIHVEEDRLPMYSTRWTVTGTPMGIVIWNIRKYMTTYPEYSPYMGLVFHNRVTRGQGVGQVRASVKRLKDLGWRIPSNIERELALSETSNA